MGDSTTDASAQLPSQTYTSKSQSSIFQSSFKGNTSDELREFMLNAKFDLDGWGDFKQLKLSQLLDEVQLGETCLGINKTTGQLIRIVNVAKPLIFDYENGLVLVELFQTFGVSASGDAKQSEQSNGPKVRGNTISEKFAPAHESPRAACMRALYEELSLPAGLLPPDMFSGRMVESIVADGAPSSKFPGLESQYMLFECLARPSSVASLVEHIPQNSLTPASEMKGMNPKTMWWYWIPISCRLGEADDGFLLDPLRKLISQHETIAANDVQTLAVEFAAGSAVFLNCACAANDVWNHLELVLS